MGAAVTLVSRAGPSGPQSKVIRQPMSSPPSQPREATHREIFKWCQVHCLCGRKETRRACKEDGANSCLTHPVWLSQQCSQASPAWGQTRGSLQICWNFPARACTGGDGAEGKWAAVRASGSGFFLSPLPPCFCPMSLKGPLVSDLRSTQQSRKPLQRALRSPK